MKNKWLHEFKIALIESDCKRLSALQPEMPAFGSREEMLEAQALIAQAIELFKRESDQTKESMEQMKKAIKFQQSNLSGNARFDKTY